jgi:hypothetical protein
MIGIDGVVVEIPNADRWRLPAGAAAGSDGRGNPLDRGGRRSASVGPLDAAENRRSWRRRLDRVGDRGTAAVQWATVSSDAEAVADAGKRASTAQGTCRQLPETWQ